MFDVDRVNQITSTLLNFVQTKKILYVMSEAKLTEYALALIKRVKANVRAVITPGFPEKPEISGLPAMQIQHAAPYFNDETRVIFFTRAVKEYPLSNITLNYGTGQVQVQVLMISEEEAVAIYNRLMIIHLIEEEEKDGVPGMVLAGFSPETVINSIVTGLTTCKNPTQEFINLKYQFLNPGVIPDPVYDLDDSAIVIQGPVVYDNNYTALTCKLYRMRYPKIPIVVSTWKGVKEEFKNFCAEQKVTVLENEVPENPASHNVNLQMTSSHKGIEFVRDNTSAKFVLKTRADNRINRPDFLLHFRNLLKNFPPNGDKLKSRIVVTDWYTFRFYPFNICDFLSFGTIEDMEKLYSVRSDITPEVGHKLQFKRYRVFAKIGKYFAHPNMYFSDKRRLVNFNRMMRKLKAAAAESYIMETFYEKFIAPIETDKLLQTYFKFLRDYLVIADSEVLILDWPKYAYQSNKVVLYPETATMGMKFPQWLDFYLNYRDEDDENFSAPEPKKELPKPKRMNDIFGTGNSREEFRLENFFPVN